MSGVTGLSKLLVWGRLLAASCLMLLALACWGTAGETAGQSPWWMGNPEAFAFDPFSLATDPALLSLYDSLFGTTFSGSRATSKPKDAATPTAPASTQTRTSASVPAGMDSALPAAAPSGGGMPTGDSGDLTVVRHALLIDARPPKRTPVLPPW